MTTKDLREAEAYAVSQDQQNEFLQGEQNIANRISSVNLSEYSVKVGGLSTYACVIITYE